MANVSTSTLAALAAFVVTFFVTFGMQMVAPNAEISDRYPTPLTPPGWTFSIWGLIFTSQGVMFALALWKGYDDRASVMHWLMAGWLAESSWQFLFATETPVSLILCAPVLVLGAFAFIQALVLCNSANTDWFKASAFEIVLVMSTAINAAWLTVAASLAILVALVANTNTDIVPTSAALAVVVAAIGATISVRENSASYIFTLLWAFWGIHTKNNDGQMIDILAMCCSALFAALGIFVLAKSVFKSKQRSSSNINVVDADGQSLLPDAGTDAVR